MSKKAEYWEQIDLGIKQLSEGRGQQHALIEPSDLNEKAWDFAVGLVQLDGIKPSEDFMELVEQEKKGQISGEDIRRILIQKYNQNGSE